MRIPENHAITPPTLEYYLAARNSFTGDVATDLAVMLIDYVRESRQLNQEQTRAETAQLRLEQAAQVKDMREEADKLRDAGMVKGAGMILGGGVTIASGFATASAATKGAANATDRGAPSAAGKGAPSETPSAPGFDWFAGLKGSADALNGGGEAWAAHIDRSAARARTRATEHEHRAGESGRRLDTLDEARAHAKELEHSAFEHLRNVQETRADTERARITWRA